MAEGSRARFSHTLSLDQQSMLAACDLFVEDKVKAQGGVPTFHDNNVRWLLHVVQDDEQVDLPPADIKRALQELSEYSGFISRQRFQNALVRLARPVPVVMEGRAVDAKSFASTQGVTACPMWAGLPVFKSAYDSLMYPTLISEMNPGTIIELGSGSGGSALWFANMTSANQLPTRIISVDINPVSLRKERIEFIQGDLNDIQNVLGSTVTSLPHPWLVVEDAHVNVLGVLRFFDKFFEPGDYMIVEDSMRKRSRIVEFLHSSARSYALDAKYADMFGENSTCAIDSILVCQ